mmetsp:Transcript_9639/g.13915  ORF Transcript_9639/g.13915 Transcript_9639/m.13915 type:complete len:207 (-) Transcript_9639:1363-1983(-)
MILSTKLVVGKQNGNFTRRKNDNKKYQKRKTKQIVVLIHPQACHDEEEFHKSGTERDEPSGKDANFGRLIPLNRRNDTFDGGNLGRELERFMLVAKVCSKEHERHSNAAPHGGQDDDVKERNSTGRLEKRLNNVEHQEEREAKSRKENRCQQGAQLPLTPFETFVQPCRPVPSKDATEHVEDEHAIDKRSTFGGGNKSDSSHKDCK